MEPSLRVCVEGMFESFVNELVDQLSKIVDLSPGGRVRDG